MVPRAFSGHFSWQKRYRRSRNPEILGGHARSSGASFPSVPFQMVHRASLVDATPLEKTRLRESLEERSPRKEQGGSLYGG